MPLLDISSGFESFVRLITLILIFIFVLALTYFSTRIAGNVQKERMTGSNIKILETMRISNSKYIQIIKIGDKFFAIAVCKDTVTCLGEVNGDELVYDNSSSGNAAAENFKAILDKFKKDKPDDDNNQEG